MTRRYRLAAILLGVAILAAACGTDPLVVSDDPFEVEEGGIRPASGEAGQIAFGGGNPDGTVEAALNVNMTTVEGADIDVSQYLGQDVVFWFWAPWCAWCNVEAERVDAIAAEFEGRVEIVGVAGASDQFSMIDFVERHELEHLTHIADLDGRFWATLDVTYQPWWMFINDDGEVLTNWQGRLSKDEIRELMTRLVDA